jgi:hypothetical protein
MTNIKFPSKPTFSGHETFALRQLWLRKAYDEIAKHISLQPLTLFDDESQDEPLDVASREVFAGADAIKRFGVGKNMVSSIRHWALACDVIRESKSEDGYYIGEVGEFLFGENAVDEFLEKDATIWLVHWLLAGRAKRSATWYVLFNHVDPQSFQPKDIVKLIEDYAEGVNLKKSKTTIARDVDVCIKCYTPVNGKAATEDSAEPLLSDLGLMTSSGNNIFQFNRGPQYSLPNEVFAYALLDFWEHWELSNGSAQATLSFNAIAYEYGAPGRVFKLSEDAVAERLAIIGETTRGHLAWTDTAGLRQVSRLGNESIATAKMAILRSAYAK